MVGSLAEALFVACASRAIVWPQNPILLNASSLPQPDLAVLHRRVDFCRTPRPGPADILLLIEIADTSLRFDPTIKLPSYASAGIPEFWLIDLNRRVLEAFCRLETDRYGTMTTHHPGESLAPTLVPEIVVTLGLIFG